MQQILITGVSHFQPFSALSQDESGQSLLEFLISLPVLVTLVVLLVKSNSAVQTGIVNQQYARAQALFLAYNSPIYPEIRFRNKTVGNFYEQGLDRLMIGISENISTEEYVPEAPVQDISRSQAGRDLASDEEQSEPRQRSKIRIRTGVVLCTQLNVLPSQIQDGLVFNYCRGGNDS